MPRWLRSRVSPVNMKTRDPRTQCHCTSISPMDSSKEADDNARVLEGPKSLPEQGFQNSLGLGHRRGYPLCLGTGVGKQDSWRVYAHRVKLRQRRTWGQGEGQRTRGRPSHSSSLPAANCLVEMETLIPAPASRQAKNISEKQQPPPPLFLISSYIWSAM